jgi:hypothetical protein
MFEDCTFPNHLEDSNPGFDEFDTGVEEIDNIYEGRIDPYEDGEEEWDEDLDEVVEDDDEDDEEDD